MLFNSWQFLFVFLPVVLGGLFLLHNSGIGRLSIVWLLIVSLAFYVYWNPLYLILLLVSILFNFFMGMVIASSHRNHKRLWLIAGVVVNIGLIGFYKYANFLGNAFAQLSGKTWVELNIILPLGISFFTFTQTAYLIDVSKGEQAEKNLPRYALFVIVFPHLIAGPILHYKDIIPQFLQHEFGIVNPERISKGLTLFVMGLFKKVVLADTLALLATPAFDAVKNGAHLSYIEAWIGSLSYTFQLYFDFSGYSDMAVGLGWIFGLNFPWNFNSPYKAVNIQDFWRRWHITLSNFMRDYVYIPLGGNRTTPMRKHVNILTTMCICGLWHGAGWTFLLWGFLHGSYMVVQGFWRMILPGSMTRINNDAALSFNNIKGDVTDEKSLPKRIMAIAVTFFAVNWAWVLFRSSDLRSAIEMWSAMIGGNGLFIPDLLLGLFGPLGVWLQSHGVVFKPIGANNILAVNNIAVSDVVLYFAVSMTLVWLVPNSREWFEKRIFLPVRVGKVFNMHNFEEIGWRPSWAWSIFAVFMTVASLMSLGRVSEFLYFQF